MNWFKDLFSGAYNKALVPVAVVVLYFINKTYGIDIPLSEDSLMLIFAAITSFVTYHVPNK